MVEANILGMGRRTKKGLLVSRRVNPMSLPSNSLRGLEELEVVAVVKETLQMALVVVLVTRVEESSHLKTRAECLRTRTFLRRRQRKRRNGDMVLQRRHLPHRPQALPVTRPPVGRIHTAALVTSSSNL